MYWILVFFAIYIFVPLIREYTTNFKYINKEVVEQISLYSLIGLISFIISNIIFMFRVDILNKELTSYTIINYKTAKNILIKSFVISVLLLMLTIGTEGITNIVNTGTRSFWLKGNTKNLLYTLAELSFFYINILGSVFFLSANKKNDKIKSLLIFI